MFKRVLASVIAAFSFLPGLSAAADPLIMGVSEGTSGGLDHGQVINKYQGLADVIGKALKRKVNVVFIREFKALEDGMRQGRFDFVYARPSDYPARGMRDYGYRFVATSKPDGRCHIIAHKSSPIRTLKDLQGKKIALPEPAAYMTKFCTAELRDQGVELSPATLMHVREQGAVVFYLENKFADVGGVASYSGVARKWEKDGNHVVHKSVAQPYFPMVAHRKVSPSEIAKVQAALVAMKDAEDEAVLKQIGIEGFDTASEARLKDLLKWLEGPARKAAGAQPVVYK